MPSVTDHIRASLLVGLGVVDRQRKPSLSELRQTCWSPRFEQFMRNRLVVGAIRHETFAQKRSNPGKYDYVTEAFRRIRSYEATANMEHLVVAANMLLLEFEFGDRAGRHFRSIDDGEHARRVK